jgi:hypothetical protein
MTSHALTTRIAQVRRRARRLMLLQAVAKVVTAILVALLATGAIDYLLRSDDRGLRILLSGTVCTVAVWSLSIWLIATMRHRLSIIQVAQQMERRYPELLSDLSSAAAFLKGPTDEIGVSTALRRAAIEQAQRETGIRSFDHVVDRRPTLWVLLAMQTLIVVVLVLFYLAPETSLTGLRRLAMPFAESPWPPRHELVIVGAPLAIPAGGDFSFSVSNRDGRLPRDLVVQYWFAGRPEGDVDEYMLKPNSDEDRVAHELSGVTVEFKYRVLGGDDRDMAWRFVRVIEPAELISLQSTILPPAYAPWPPRSSSGDVSALVGSKIEIAGTATKPLAAATIHVGSGDRVEQFSANIDASGYKFTLSADQIRSWVVAESGEYWITLRDVEAGVSHESRRWSVEAVVDQPPTLQVHQPVTISLATPFGILPVRIEATDDVAISKVELVAAHPAPGRASIRQRLYQRATDLKKQRPTTITRDGVARDVITVDQRCDVATLGGETAGQTLKLRFIATDVMQQVAQSDLLEVSIISPDDLVDQIAERQSQLIKRLQEAFAKQEEVLSATRDLRIQASDGVEMDLAALRAIDFRQRQVQQLLADEGDGVLYQLEQLVEELLRNRLDESDLCGNLRAASGSLALLNVGELASAGNLVSAALRTAESENPDAAKTSDLLTRASDAQEQVVASLNDILDKMVEWDRYNTILRQWTSLIAELEDGAAGVAEHLATAGKTPVQLESQQVDSLRRLSRSQWSIANRLAGLLIEADAAATQLRSIDPRVARALRVVTQGAEDGRLTETMDSTAHDIHYNRVGLALAQQNRAIRLMRQLARALRLDSDPQQDVASGDHLAPLRGAIVDMLARQTSIQQGISEIHQLRLESGSLTRPLSMRTAELLAKQQDLADECEQAAATCGSAPACGPALLAARRSMLQVTSELSKQTTGVETVAAADHARRQLAYIARALTKRAAAGIQDPHADDGGGNNRKELAVEQLRLIEMLQRDINLRTRELHAVRETTGTLTAKQQAELKQLATEQAVLADVLTELIGRTENKDELIDEKSETP